MLKMASSFVLGANHTTMYPRGYIFSSFSPAALLDTHFEQPASY
jgi:hypothetical protein